MSASRPGRKLGVWDKVFQTLVKFYRRERRIQWRWQAVDSRSCAAPLGGEKTGKNPTDRAKLGSKIHILVDQRGEAGHRHQWRQPTRQMVGQPIWWFMLREAPGSEQHFLADKGYDFDDVRQPSTRPAIGTYQTATQTRPARPRDVPSARGDPVARRWVVERTFAWLVKRRSVRTRWCKKTSNWLAFVQFACASILCDLTVFG